jgi:hypothetical protein
MTFVVDIEVEPGSECGRTLLPEELRFTFDAADLQAACDIVQLLIDDEYVIRVWVGPVDRPKFTLVPYFCGDGNWVDNEIGGN